MQVTLAPSAKLRFLPNPECDPLEFGSLAACASHIRGCGYYGGLRLLQAMAKRFLEHCQERGIRLPPSAGNFSLAYRTTIPRQVRVWVWPMAVWFGCGGAARHRAS